MKVIHFHNGTGGGVLSVIKNLLQYSRNGEVENYVVYVINQEKQSRYNPPHLPGAVRSTVFYYSSKWNFYYTCKRLAAYIPDETYLLVAHDWLELGMVTQLGLKNPVVQFVHGDYDYYYQLAVKHVDSISAYVCVSSAINQKLQRLLPHRIKDIAYLKLPVPDLRPVKKSMAGRRLVFIGRCENEKGYPLLPLIDQQLQIKGLCFEWHIYGEGSSEKEKQLIWANQANVFFHGVVSGEEIIKVLPTYDFLILPTIAEGMPVTVIEAMKAGVVPVVNHLSGGLEELIGNNERGVLIEQNRVENYATSLQQLQQQPERARKMAQMASAYACSEFDAVNCTLTIETFIASYAKNIRQVKAQKAYGSRLDQKWLPNLLVCFFRSLSAIRKGKR